MGARLLLLASLVGSACATVFFEEKFGEDARSDHSPQALLRSTDCGAALCFIEMASDRARLRIRGAGIVAL